MVIGASDTGKTSFCTQLLNAAVEAGVQCALVDADMGQSEVGPPGTIGLGVPTTPVELPGDIPVRRMYFTGTTSPVGNMLPSVVGIRKMVDEALAHGSKLIVVDTTGLVRGVLGIRFKTHKVDLLAPSHIVALQREHEMHPLIAAFSKLENTTIHQPAVSELARPKTPEFRATRRRHKMARHFKDAEEHTIRLDDVSCWGSWLNSGRLMPWQRVRLMEQILKTRVLHAEGTGQGYYVIVDRAPDAENIKALENRVGTRDITIVPGNAFTYAYVGLADGRGKLLDVGIIHAIDFRQRHISVITKLKTIAPVSIIRFGMMRVKPDGTELPKIRPGEL